MENRLSHWGGNVRIISVDVKNEPDDIHLHSRITRNEFEQLKGKLENIGIFPIDSISNPTNLTKTGARNGYAKWLLLPVKVRLDYKTDEYDYEGMKCGLFECGECVFFIYKVEKRVWKR